MKNAIIRSATIGVILALLYNLSTSWMGFGNKYDYAFYAVLGMAGVMVNLKFFKKKAA